MCQEGRCMVGAISSGDGLAPEFSEASNFVIINDICLGLAPRRGLVRGRANPRKGLHIVECHGHCTLKSPLENIIAASSNWK